jgi:alpha-amylase
MSSTRYWAALTMHFQRLKNAIAFPFIHDGIPIVYYGALYIPRGITNTLCLRILGQEQGYTGGQDPANREAYASSDCLDQQL